MISLSSDVLANGLHVALGALFVTFPVCWGIHHPQLWGSGVGIMFGIVKEFWFDLKYEDPDTSGGIAGGFEDLAGYFIGIVLANFLILL